MVETKSASNSSQREADKAQEKANQTATDLRQDVLIEIPGRTVVKTAEDATQQFLRGQIDESQMRAVWAAHGVTSTQLPPRGIEAPDAAFENKIPEDLVERPTEEGDVHERIKRMEEKTAVREAATKAAEKVTAKAEPEADLNELRNEASTAAGEKVEEKQNK